MALRIQYCLLFIDPNQVAQGGGTATITFEPFELSSAPAGVSLTKKRAIGPPGPYLGKPIAMVTARQFLIAGAAGQTLAIDDTVTLSDVTVTWRGGHVKVHEEIPVLIIGEVADPVPPVVGEIITIRVTDVRLRDSVFDFLKSVDLIPDPSFEPGSKKKSRKRSTPKPARAKRGRARRRRA